jgi:hypothetical protein
LIVIGSNDNSINSSFDNSSNSYFDNSINSYFDKSINSYFDALQIHLYSSESCIDMVSYKIHNSMFAGHVIATKFKSYIL